MQVGLGQVDAQVIEKLPPRNSKDGKNTYYTLLVGDVGWSQRMACNLAVYNAVVAGDKKTYRFTGPLTGTRATRSGSNFADDMQQLTLESVKEAPAAAPAAAAK